MRNDIAFDIDGVCVDVMHTWGPLLYDHTGIDVSQCECHDIEEEFAF